jgi:hypothetical protein
VIVNSDSIRVTVDHQDYSFNKEQLPQPFLEWQSTARMEMIKTLQKSGPGAVKSQPAHLPVLASWNDGFFSINLATRGVGLLPKKDKVERYIHLFEQAVEESQNDPWEETLERRMCALGEFYCDEMSFDAWMLGGLEIFDGQTLQNLQSNPLCALLFTGEAPRYPSYQFNAVAELIDQGNAYYRFLLAARQMFSRDAFHIFQSQYSTGYLFHIVGIKNKTPYPRK